VLAWTNERTGTFYCRMRPSVNEGEPTGDAKPPVLCNHSVTPEGSSPCYAAPGIYAALHLRADDRRWADADRGSPSNTASGSSAMSAQ
jgi:hypothetical protein